MPFGPTSLGDRVMAPAPLDADIDVAGLTHKGLVRDENQDHFLVCTMHKTLKVLGTSLPHRELLEVPSERIAGFAMVADGVGGGRGGEEASRTALQTIASFSTQAMRCFYTSNPAEEAAFLEALQEAARVAHQEVVAHRKDRPDLEGMATTLTMLISLHPWIYVLQVGDSRCYRLRGDVLERLTRDQTMAQDLVDQGALTASRAERSPLSSILSSAIGGEAHPVVGRFDSAPEDVVLLCTDGLTRHVPDERIRQILAGMDSAAQACQQLVQAALEGGGMDNVTVVVGRARALRR